MSSREGLKRVYLNPSPSSSFIYLLLSDNLSLHYENSLRPVDFPVFVELNSGSDIDMLLFALVVRVLRI